MQQNPSPAGVLAILAVAALVQLGRAQPLSDESAVPAWQPTFGGSPHKGKVWALALASDGAGGQNLVVGGNFAQSVSAQANGIKLWDGMGWFPLGDGFLDTVRALTVHEDGVGPPTIYAGGEFVGASGFGASHVAAWDGTGWSPLGGGTNNDVYALALYDEGNGPVLFAGGIFSTAGGVPAKGIARWDGRAWSSVGGSLGSGIVSALTVFDDGQGGGPALYAAGTFSVVGGVAAKGIARWDGATWSPLGAGLTGWVHALTVFDDGQGARLVAGGEGLLPTGSANRCVAAWDGANWSAVGSGLSNIAQALAAVDAGDGQGPRLYVAGDLFLQGNLECIARLDGEQWTSMDGGTDPFVFALAGFDNGRGGQDLYAGGLFSDAGDVFTNGLARWDGNDWSVVGAGPSSSVSDFEIHDDGSGAALYLGGSFDMPYGGDLGGVARWSGSTLTLVGGGTSAPAYVDALCSFDDGGGPALFAAGSFTTMGGVPALRIARWDGTTWSALGAGLDGVVHALAAFDDGRGAALYAAGEFTLAGGLPANRVARWDGASWEPLGDGLDGYAKALAVYDDGRGPALFVGGAFLHAGGVAANRIARWDGSTWEALGSGVADVGSASVNALVVYDLGSGPRLYVGGDFTLAGGQAAQRVAGWDGQAWSALGAGVGDHVHGLAGLQLEGLPALAVGGRFVTAGGAAAARIAAWNGTAWSPLGAGMNDTVSALDVLDLDDGAGPSLFAGGSFTVAWDSGDGSAARWGLPVPASPWTVLGSGLAGLAGVPELDGTGTLVAGSPGSVALSGASPAAAALLLVALDSTPAPFKGGVLVPLPVALALPLATDANGTLALAWTAWPAGVPAGTAIYLQCAVTDAGAVQGVALSNALLATTP